MVGEVAAKNRGSFQERTQSNYKLIDYLFNQLVAWNKFIIDDWDLLL